MVDQGLHGVLLPAQHDPAVAIAVGQDSAARVEAGFRQQAQGEGDLPAVPNRQFCRFTKHRTEYASSRTLTAQRDQGGWKVGFQVQVAGVVITWARNIADRRDCRPLGGEGLLSMFEVVEALVLPPLPERPFVLARWSTATVGRDIHIKAGRLLGQSDCRCLLSDCSA
jgi:hypothetical protein